MSEVTKRETVEGLPAEGSDGRPRGPLGRGWRPRYRLAAALCATVVVVLAAWSMNVLVSDRGEAATTAEDGALPDDLSVTPFDTHHPSIARLDGALLEAVQEAARDARGEGIVLHVTSGWRSEAYQRHLLDEAVLDHGSREEARRLVSTPEESRHVTGEAIDIGPTDAADWLIRRGSAYGLCQVYANEMWHFELLTEPGGNCPDLLPDAAG
ncbi:M15 family metallopeptidase [Nocardiopsis synnemataformans]|uniref:M15 family metallopeptidase n=1 Tax=Nocardiopsis synnemataformans TaxID=61305 RepID=UPI003EC09EEF